MSKIPGQIKIGSGFSGFRPYHSFFFLEQQGPPYHSILTIFFVYCDEHVDDTVILTLTYRRNFEKKFGELIYYSFFSVRVWELDQQSSRKQTSFGTPPSDPKSVSQPYTYFYYDTTIFTTLLLDQS